MHTDEYEISLSRELAVCERYVRKYGSILAGMERQNGMTTEQFLACKRDRGLAPSSDLAAWRQAAAALETWSRKRAEYGRLLAAMKQSPPQ